jgi:2-dehydro-3-deoxygluconokinase
VIRYFEQRGGGRIAASVVTFGEAMLRLATPAGLPLATTPTLHPHVAGAEANVAVALAHLGVATRWAGALPEGPLGEHVARELAGAGVLLDAVQWHADGRLGLFFAEMGGGARPTRVVYDRASSVATRLKAVPRQALEDTAFLHVTGITPALGAQPAAALEETIAAARDAGARISVDLNYRALLWEPDAARAALVPILGEADVVFCGIGDARQVLGLGGDAGDVADALRAGFAPNAAHVVITLGEEGAVARDARGVLQHQPAIPTTIVDPFGMGDAFAAGVLWGLLDDDLPRGLRAGAMLAARKATVHGDLSPTGVAELQQALEAQDTMEILR